MWAWAFAWAFSIPHSGIRYVEMKKQQHPRNGRDMELYILETVDDFGEILPGSLSSETLRSQFRARRGEVVPNLQQQATAVFNYLLEERYLFPFMDAHTGAEVLNYAARGLTPKGYDRLQQLRHPKLHWLRNNWFPTVVAISTLALSIASIVTNAISGTD